MNIFISGSMSINQLPNEAIDELDNIIEKKINVLIGDAKGVDLQVQKYLQEKNYSNVIVYYVGKEICNNVGSWQTKCIETKFNTIRRFFYAAKDKAMAVDTDWGLMIWDGKSKGTLNNIKTIHDAHKKFHVIWNGKILTDDNINAILPIDIVSSNKNVQQLTLF